MPLALALLQRRENADHAEDRREQIRHRHADADRRHRSGVPDVIIRPLSAWMMLSIALPVPGRLVAPKPEIEQ